MNKHTAQQIEFTHRPISDREIGFFTTMFNHYCERLKVLPKNDAIRHGYGYYKSIISTQLIHKSFHNIFL